ncbi:MAG: flagellar motor switch protein FliM [Pseudomonadota bacterium]
MAQILSQDEIDALLKGVSDGEVQTEPEDVEEISGVISYDFTSQDRVIKHRMPTLDVIYDSFARSLRHALSTSLRKVVDVKLLTSDMKRFGDFVNSIPVPSHLNIIRMAPLRGLCIMVVEAKLVFSLVDVYFGGSGGNVNIEGRDFSPIEQKVMKKFVGIMLDDLKEAWEPIQPLEIELIRSEINPQFISVISSSDVVLVTAFEIELERASGQMTLCVPYSTLEPVRSKLLPGGQKVHVEKDQRWVTYLSQHLMDAAANITVELGNASLNGRDILNLQVGDVIQLEKDVDEELVLKIEGIPKFTGFPGLFRGNRALKLTSVIPTTRGKV